MPPILAALLLLVCLVRDAAALELSQFAWSADAERNTTSLAVCSPGPLLDGGDVSSVVLVVGVAGTTTQYEYSGTLVDDLCVAFSTSGIVRLPQGETTYIVMITALVDGAQELVTGVASFSMEVDTATLPCSGRALTRALAPPTATFEDCLNDISLFGNVCYTEGDLSSSALCFTLSNSDPQGLRVCLEGSSPAPPVTDDGLLTISFLAYSSYSPTNATVSLAVTGAAPSAEAVFWEDGAVYSVSLFSDEPWNTTSFAPRFAEYAVCVVDTDQDGQPVTSSSASVTDLAVRVANSRNRDDEDVLLQFSFTNANPRSTYRVSVWGSLPSLGAPLEVDPLDCIDVGHNTTCYRFMEYSGVEKDVYVAIEYADEGGIPVDNMVVVPYSIERPINDTEAEEVSSWMSG